MILLQAMKNIENRKKRPDYRPYDEVDDETGMVSHALFLFTAFLKLQNGKRNVRGDDRI